MNPLPILALAVVASGYAVAVETTDRHFHRLPGPDLTAYAATAQQDLSVYDVLGHGAQPMDEPHCGAHALIADTLRHDFAESPVERRRAGDGLTVELWASQLMGTWTMVHRGSDGISCIIGSGTGWQAETQADAVFAALPLAS